MLNVILDGKECEINYIPIMQHSPGICLADEAVAKEIMEKFYERSRKITDPLFVENRFKEEVEKNKYYLIQRIDYFSNSFLYKSLKKIVGIKFIQRYYQAYCKKIALRAQNSIECESWREFLIAALEENL